MSFGIYSKKCGQIKSYVSIKYFSQLGKQTCSTLAMIAANRDYEGIDGHSGNENLDQVLFDSGDIVETFFERVRKAMAFSNLTKKSRISWSVHSDIPEWHDIGIGVGLCAAGDSVRLLTTE